MLILAIDPGTRESAWLAYDSAQKWIAGFAKEENQVVLQRVRAGLLGFLAPTTVAPWENCTLVIEKVESYGMTVGVEVFDTVFWSGRFAEATAFPFELFPNKDVRLHLCGSMRAKDPNIRRALLDRFGGDLAKGTKKQPGPLYGVANDVWSALALAVTYADKMEGKW